MNAVQTQFTELKQGLIDEAHRRFGRIHPCGSRKSLDECFTFLNNELLLWFNTADGSTRVICAVPRRPRFPASGRTAGRFTAILFGANA